MELAVPGTYIAGEPLVTIAAFAPQLQVIASKQRPRKLTVHGGDGAEYMFLLKGHEDLRQDERVMQLFGLVNSMLAAGEAVGRVDWCFFWLLGFKLFAFVWGWLGGGCVRPSILSPLFS